MSKSELRCPDKFHIVQRIAHLGGGVQHCLQIGIDKCADSIKDRFSIPGSVPTGHCQCCFDSKYLNKKVVSGICGQVENSVIPGYYGLEAGQSAFGDYLAWFKKIIEWPLKNTLQKTSNINEDQKKEIISIYEDNLLVD